MYIQQSECRLHGKMDFFGYFPFTSVSRVEAMSGLERLAEMMENPVGDDDTDINLYQQLHQLEAVAAGWRVGGWMDCCFIHMGAKHAVMSCHIHFLGGQ